MILDRVTITGADDSVDILALADLSDRYPFVEWGILFGSSQGRPRFPSDAWLNELRLFVRARRPPTPPLKLSAHLCSRWVSDAVLKADLSWARFYEDLAPIFSRVQLNFHGQFHRAADGFEAMLRSTSAMFILQCDGVNDETVRRLAVHGSAVPLFDRSGGAGILTESWPPSIAARLLEAAKRRA